MDDFYDPMTIEGGLLYDDVYGSWLDDSSSRRRNGGARRRSGKSRPSVFDEDYYDVDEYGDDEDRYDEDEDEDEDDERGYRDDFCNVGGYAARERSVEPSCKSWHSRNETIPGSAEDAPAQSAIRSAAELQSALDSLRREEGARIAGLSGLERAMEMKTDLGKRFLGLRKQQKSCKGDQLTSVNRRMDAIRKQTEQPEFTYEGVPSIYDVAADRIREALSENAFAAVKRFRTTEAIRAFAKRSCHQAVRSAANVQEARCLAAIAEREKGSAAKRRAEREAHREEERHRIQQDPEAIKADVVKRIKRLQRREADRIAKLSLMERAMECGSVDAARAASLAAQLSKIRKQEQRADGEKDAALDGLRARCAAIESELPSVRARIDELSERKKTATSELSGLQRKLLFGNKRRQQELTAEIGALERRMANDRIVADRLENELKARNAEIAQTDKSSSILALKQKERSLEAELRRIESDLENQEDDFTVANMYNGLTKEFRDAFERDCVKAAHDYRDDAAIKRMALKLHGLADA